MSIRNSDDRTVDRWRLEPRFKALEIDDPPDLDHVPTLWKDLTLVSVVAVVLWVTAAVLSGWSSSDAGPWRMCGRRSATLPHHSVP